MKSDRKNVIIMDGGMGQELRRRSSRPPSPLWSAQVMLDEPELVVAAHRDYIEAGAKVIILNTYSATPQRLERDADPGLFELLQAAALDAARKACEESEKEDVRIAGCLPPLVGSYHHEIVPDNATCLQSYRRIVAAQAEGVDLFICETMSLAREALAAVTAAVESNLPVWVAFTVDDGDGTRLRSGESLAEAAEQVVRDGAEGLLVNCSAPEAVTTAMDVLARFNVIYGGYANGFKSVDALQPGGTVDVLEARKDLDPATYAEHALGWAKHGAGIIGGCCEVGPAHIRALAEKLAEHGYKRER